MRNVLCSFYLCCIVGNFALAQDKINACFITINSSEEKHSFTKHLSTGKNAGKFEFHELVPDSGEFDWFENACKKNIRCDLLVVSGHFAGSFFGEDSDVNLSMEELETRSCKNDCKGVMSAPKEVFLLGCNTLAGKAEDNRSAGEYLEVLLQDGIDLEEASRRVEQRYGAVGSSFADSMRRAFKGVPHIYGFHSVGPSGKSIDRLLKNYYKEVPDYSQHLTRIELERGLALMSEFENWNKKNTALAEALRITHFAQTSGVLIPCSGAVADPQDPMAEMINNICPLRAGDLSSEEAIEHVGELLRRDDAALYFSAVGDYLDRNAYLESAIKDGLNGDPLIKQNILSLLSDSKTGFGKIKIAQVAEKIGIINSEEFLKIEKDSILSYLSMPISEADTQALCNHSPEEKLQIKREDLEAGVFNSVQGIRAIQCLDLNDEGIVSAVLGTAKSASGGSELAINAMLALGFIGRGNSAALDFLNGKLATGREDEKMFAFMSLADLGEGNDLMFKRLEDMLNSQRNFSFGGYEVPERELAAQHLLKLRYESYDQFKKFYDMGKGSIPNVEWDLPSAITKMDVEGQINFLKDPEFQSNLEIRGGFYQQFDFNSAGEGKKLDMRAAPFLIKDLERSNGQGTLFYQMIWAVEVNDEEDKKALLDLIKNADITKKSRAGILEYAQRINASN